MTNRIIQKVCGFAASAVMALSGIAGPVANAWAEDSVALAGAGAEENVQPEEAPVLYRITLPWTEHLIIEPEKDHIYIPDPDMRTEEEMKDILLTYEAGEEVEIGIRAEDTWQITKLSFLDDKKEENGYEWKDQTTAHFFMPEKNLLMKAELTAIEVPEPAPQEVPRDTDGDADSALQPGLEADPPLQAGAQPAEPQAGTAEPAAVQNAGAAENVVQNTGDEAGSVQEDGAADPAPENTQQPADMGTGHAGSETGEQSASENSGAETEPSMTYIPEKDADGLPVQGSIEQTQVLEIVLNDAGFDAKIDLRNVPYDPEQYSIEYISDDICIDVIGTYSCIYKVTVPESGKFFFVLRPVKVVEQVSETAVVQNTETAAVQNEAGTDKAGSGMETEPQTELKAASESENSSETGVSVESETAAGETEAPSEETEDMTETETEQPSGEYKVTITEGEDLGVKLDHEDGAYDAGETVTFTMDDSQNALIAVAALKDESNKTENTADILYSEVSYNEGQDSFSFEMPPENVSLAVTRDAQEGGMMLLAAAADDEDDESWDDQTDVEAGSYYYFSDGKTHPFSSDMGSGGNDSYKYVRYKVDGVTYTVNAYCMQHSESSPPSGHTYKSMTELAEDGDDVYLRKAIFYGYGGPGWGGTFGGQNIKSIIKDKYGVGKETRAMQHYIVDYLYDGEHGFGGSLSKKAKNMIKEVKAALNLMPDPAAVSLTPTLSTTSDGDKTDAFTWNADPAYILTVTLEPGVVLVNDSTGARTGGAASVAGGETFHLEATGENTNLTGQYPLTCNYPFDFHAMLLKLKNSQDIGFGYYTNGAGLTLKVKWELKRPFEIQKIDAPTGKAAPYNSRYSFAGMQFTVYQDAALTQPVTTVTTDAAGHGTSEPLFYGTYYGKETKPPMGYIASNHVFTIVIGQDVTVDGAATGTVNVSDDIIRKRIGIQKHDKETGKAEPYNSLVTFEGAEYTVYSDSSCTKAVTTIRCNKAGYAQTDPLPVATYYLKETKRPSGYELDQSVHAVTSDFSGTVQVHTDISSEQVIRKPIEVQKYDKDTGKPEPHNTACTFEGAQYTVYSDQGCANAMEVLTLNAAGYAKSAKKYVIGTYYLKETKPPRGYNIDKNVYACRVVDDGSRERNDFSSVVHVNSVDEVIKGNVSIAKFFDDDADESVLQDWINNEKLKGIRFTLTHEDPKVPPLEMTTDKYGHAETPERSMVYGTWTIREDASTTPDKYEALKEAAFKIEIEEETLRYVVSNQLISVRLQISKKDADTGSMIPIRGAKFQILDKDGKAITMPDNLDYSKMTDTFTTNEEGVIVLTSKLEYGSYTVKEVYAPDGYLLSEEQKITLSKQNADNHANYVVEYPDKPQKGRLRMTKIDQDTGETIGEGFTFDVFTAAPVTDAAGVPYTMEEDGKEKILDKAGIKVATVVTDENGLAVTGALYLGKYVVKEVGSAEYYALNPKEYPAEIVFDRQVVDVDVDLQVPNEKTKFDLFKVDSEQEDLPLAGITFRIFSSSDKEAEKARQVAEAVEEKRREQQPLKDDFIEKQAKALEAFSEGEDVTEEDIAAYRENQEKEAADYEASLEAECAELEKALMITLEIEDTSMLGTEYVTDENGQIHVEDLLHENTYTIYETKTLPGYNLDTTIHEFTVDKNGLINGESRYTLTLANVPNNVEISKKDITGNDELPGATLTVKDAEGNVIETWVSEETPHRIKALPAGVYTLTEEQAPDGYAVAEDITFTVTDSLEIQTVTMYDEKLEIHFSKKDITGEKELPGAHLSVTDLEGNVIEEWTSTEEEHVVNLKVGTYTLTETAPPDKYATAESITFEVKDDLSVQKVEMLDAPLVIEVSKQDITTGKELPGAHLTITDKDGNVVDEWDSTEEPHKTTLSQGDYILTEVLAPDGFAKAEAVAFTVTDTAEVQKVEMKDKPIEVEISKQDITNGQELPGAQLTITDKDGNKVEEWTSTDTPHKMNLPAGEYILIEVAAPDRYSKAESINFTITDIGDVQKVEMKDKLIEVEVSKKDITNDEELPGAHLIIKDKDGKTVEEWTSTDVPHMVNLPAGDYTLTEVTAPKGYDVAETVPFTVTDSMEIQHVQMYDSPKDSVIDLTGKKKKTTTEKSNPGTPGTPGTPGVSTPGTTVTASPVQTGDFNRYLIPGIIFGAGVALMAVLMILKGRDAKRSGKE